MPFALLSEAALTAVTVGEQQTSRKGQKYSEIRFSGTQPCFQLAAEARSGGDETKSGLKAEKNTLITRNCYRNFKGL